MRNSGILRAASAALLLAAVHAPELAAQRDTTALRDSVQRLPTLDVTTTATRSTRRPLEQPLAMTAVRPGEWFGGTGASLDQALAFVPGVIATARYGGTDIRLSIRGFGARGAGDRSNSGTSRGVRVVQDGFPETEPDGRTAFDLVDLAAATAVDVIRSNASATWGNAAGGVVSLSTLRHTDRTYAGAEFGGGSFSARRMVLRAGTPLGEAGGVGGLTLTRTITDGWRAHSDGERTLVTAGVQTPLGTRGRLGVFASGTSNFFRIPGPLTMAQVEADPQQANPVYAGRGERRHNRLGRLGALYEHHVGSHEVRTSLYVQPKFLQRSERNTFRDFTRYHVGGSALYRYRHRIGSAQGILSAGIDEAYQDGAILFYALSPDNGRGDELRTNKREGANNFGFFVQQELAFNDRWNLVVGTRFDDITYYTEDFLDAGLSGTRSFRRVTPKLGLNYRRTPTHSFYTSVGGGVEAPAGNETDPAPTQGQDSVFAINPLLEPIISTTWEAGTKQIVVLGAAADWILSYDAAVYYTDVRNEIVPYRGGRFYFTAGRAGRLGAELGGRVQKGGVALLGSVSVTDYQYREYLVDSVHYGRPGAVADYSGNAVVGAPDLTWAAGVEWSPMVDRGPRLRFQLQGMTDSWADDANEVNVPGWTIASLTAGFDTPVRLGGGLGLRGFITVNNLFDRAWIGSAFLNPDRVDGVPVAFEPGAPRNLVLSLSLGWN